MCYKLNSLHLQIITQCGKYRKKIERRICMKSLFAKIKAPLVEIFTPFKLHHDGLTIRKTDVSKKADKATTDHKPNFHYSVLYQEMVDYHALKYHLKNVIENQPGGLVMSHSNAECSTLSIKEHLKIIKKAVEESNGRVPVFGATTSNATSTVLELALGARDLGVDAIIIDLPYYNRAQLNGVRHHYEIIRQYIDLPIVMSLNTARSNAEINPGLIHAMAKDGIIDGLIIEHANKEHVDYLLKHRLKNLPIFTNDYSMCHLMTNGADGVVSSVANFDYLRIYKLYQALKEKNTKLIGNLQAELGYIVASMAGAPPPLALKAVMASTDKNFHELFRPPLYPVQSDIRGSLQNMMENMGYI